MRVHVATAAELGDTVREHRRRAGLRQDDLALAAGTGRRFISDLERGKATVRLGAVLDVVQALGLTVELSDRQDDG